MLSSFFLLMFLCLMNYYLLIWIRIYIKFHIFIKIWAFCVYPLFKIVPKLFFFNYKVHIKWIGNLNQNLKKEKKVFFLCCLFSCSSFGLPSPSIIFFYVGVEQTTSIIYGSYSSSSYNNWPFHHFFLFYCQLIACLSLSLSLSQLLADSYFLLFF